MKDLVLNQLNWCRLRFPAGVYDRIVALLDAANADQPVSNERVEEYVSAVLEGHARGLRL